MHYVQGKSGGWWSKILCFILIQTYFAFSSFTTLLEFEGVYVRHTVVLALAVICDCLWHYSVWYCQRSDFWLHSSISPWLFLKILSFCSMFSFWIPWLSKQMSLWAPFFRPTPFLCYPSCSFPQHRGKRLPNALIKPSYRRDCFFWHSETKHKTPLQRCTGKQPHLML